MLHCLRTLSKPSNLIMHVQQLKGYCHNHDWLCHATMINYSVKGGQVTKPIIVVTITFTVVHN